MKPITIELVWETEQHYFLPDHNNNNKMLEDIGAVFLSKKSISIDKFTGPGLALLISLYSQGNAYSLCWHVTQYSEI